MIERITGVNHSKSREQLGTSAQAVNLRPRLNGSSKSQNTTNPVKFNDLPAQFTFDIILEEIRQSQSPSQRSNIHEQFDPSFSFIVLLDPTTGRHLHNYPIATDTKLSSPPSEVNCRKLGHLYTNDRIVYILTLLWSRGQRLLSR